LQTKYLNQCFVVGCGEYGDLGLLLISALCAGPFIPLVAIAPFGRRIVL